MDERASPENIGVFDSESLVGERRPLEFQVLVTPPRALHLSGLELPALRGPPKLVRVGEKPPEGLRRSPPPSTQFVLRVGHQRSLLRRVEQDAGVFDQQQQVQRVGRRRLEVEVGVESAGLLMQRVHQ